ncbi:MAG TPA: CPCC family cysteine-rich protein [Candidatus Elarobacter sp.]|nr:CPCC family cysteine-rich protein [Candidatus Elarobacter sp.]
MSDGDRAFAPLPLLLYGDTDCPVCGLGAAFVQPKHYDVCRRCGWGDDPDAYARPDEQSETNETSLNEAIARWPRVLAESLSTAPLSAFEIAVRDDEIGGYDYIVDGKPVRELYGTGTLRASIGPWPAPGDWSANLVSGGRSETPTGRTRLYVCHLCGGDDYEPALTAAVRVGDERVIWSRIGLEEYEYSSEGWQVNLRNGPAGFAFDARDYRAAFSRVSPRA